MLPKLFEIPLFPLLKTSWPVFIILVAILAGLVTFGTQYALKSASKLKAQLVSTLPFVVFVTAFVVFVESPFGRMPINSYGFCIMVGFLLASWVGVRRAKALGIKSDFILDLGIISMIAGIIGAKINYLLQYSHELDEGTKAGLFGDMGLDPFGALLLGPIPFVFWFWRMKQSGEKVRLYSWQTGVLLVLTLALAFLGTRALHLYRHSPEYSWKLFTTWQSGFVLYGGLIAGVAAGILYTKMRNQSVGVMADLTAAPMMLALAFGRVGCFMNGCCHGKVGPKGFPCVSFPAGSPASIRQGKSYMPSDPVYPTQLFEAVAALAFFFFLSWLYKKKRKAQGELFLIMGMLYAAWRFTIEFARGDERPTWIGSLSYSQVVSLSVFLIAGVWLYFLRRRAQPVAPPPPPAEPSAPAPTGPA
jgi:phosphatidylglycerol:prolipoprotein diacylglycerol transferase